MLKKRSYVERAEYLKMAVSNRRKKIREMAVKRGGGKCCICAYDKCVSALNFHHLDPSQKKFGLSVDGLTRSWKRVKNETDKCILLCANCHAEVHDGITQLPTATSVEKQGELLEA